MKCLVPGDPFGPALPLDSSRLLFLNGLRIIVKNHESNQREKNNVDVTNHRINTAEALEVHDQLGTHFNADKSADDHDKPKLVVHIPELGVPHGGDHGFAGNMGHIGADGKRHGKAQDV